eukprot:TRINITY_DN17925_c0_g1_i1.p1 TRINITY_DN17925_c0_g1~~TRINITY_DN17925_c0_g1_i1.p1  ORF type:complete len:136 (-),score=24.21 TRINITY_DN17925_c0_g1_i1:42-422(-)
MIQILEEELIPMRLSHEVTSLGSFAKLDYSQSILKLASSPPGEQTLTTTLIRSDDLDKDDPLLKSYIIIPDIQIEIKRKLDKLMGFISQLKEFLEKDIKCGYNGQRKGCEVCLPSPSNWSEINCRL